MGKSNAMVAEGRRLAIEMLTEIRDLNPEECSCEDHFRPDKAQHDVFGRYLDLLIASSSDVRAGFCIVMNDFLGAAEDMATEVDHYEKLEAEGYDRNAQYFPAPDPSDHSRAAKVSAAIASFRQRR